MPAIQSIRKHGALLIGIIGAALFAFIAEEAFRSMETTSNASKQQVGLVYGQALNYPEFMEMVNNETEIAKMQMGGNLTDQQNDRINDQVWQEFVQYQLVKHEADALGLIVTDEEVQQALREGTARSLTQTLPIFSQTGRFDYEALKNFLTEYEKNRKSAQGEQMEQFELWHRLWQYAEAKLRRELLMNKYQILLASTTLSNPVNAEQNFNDRNTLTTATVAALPYVAMKDKVQVTDDELKAAYEKYKGSFLDFYNLTETRDIKYIDVAVTASQKDQAELDKQMHEVYDKLNGGEDPAVVLSSTNTLVRYADMAVGAQYFPRDIAAKLDSMSVGTTTQPYRNSQDNTMNVVKLIAKTNTADSILYRALFLADADEAKLKTRHDSVMNALNGGADFKAIAKKYGQPADSTWITSSQLDQGANQPDNVKIAKALYEANGLTSIEMNGGHLVIKVESKKGSAVKYQAAVAKCEIAFSKQTYNDAKNKMNMFLSKNSDLASVEKAAAKEGYQIVDCPNFTHDLHYIGANGMNPGVAGSKKAVTWVFDDAKVGQISGMYECGPANDHLLIVGLAGVHEAGYRAWDDKEVKERLTAIVTAEKKKELARKQFTAKTIEDAQKNPAVVVTDSVKGSFFQSPIIPSTKASEPLIAAALNNVKVGACSAPIYGSAGAYIFKVLSHDKGTQKFDKVKDTEADAQYYNQLTQRFFYYLYKKANVIDNRYKF